MITKLSNVMVKYAKGRIILVFFLLLLLFAIVIVPKVQSKLETSSGGTGFVDMLFSYTPEKAYSMISSYGNEGRALYRTFTSSADFVYPVVYSIFFSLIMTWLLQHGFTAGSKLQRLNIIPFGAMVFDWIENVNLLIMLSQYPVKTKGVAEFSSICTTLKWSIGILAILVVVIAFVMALKNGFKIDRSTRGSAHFSR
jgi:hypothetical protein